MELKCSSTLLGASENIALGAIMSKFEYVKLADAIAADISNGTLRPGDRLPPQRNFAYDRGIAVSTASRVYTELLRRGLVVGEVGRGTFISGDIRREVEALTEPRDARIDFEVNYPLLPQQWAMIAKSLAGLERVDALEVALRRLDQHRHQERAQCGRRLSRAQGFRRRRPSRSSSPPTASSRSPPRSPRSCPPAAAAASRR